MKDNQTVDFTYGYFVRREAGMCFEICYMADLIFAAFSVRVRRIVSKLEEPGLDPMGDNEFTR
jgi:hypothetical protein